jgi:hypothetical protein
MTARNNLPTLARFGTLVAVVLFVLASASVAQAQVWTESGDAGPLVSNAQVPVGAGAITTIIGTLGAANDADVYAVRLPSVAPAGLPLIQLQCTVNQGPNVYLFDAAGLGVLTTSICSGGSKTILAPNVSLPVGTYYVATAFSGLDPQSAGGAIWLPFLSAQHAADGSGATQTLSGWTGTPLVQASNAYQMTLTNMAYISGPVPTRPSRWGSLKLLYR